jgi:hypothetical protein
LVEVLPHYRSIELGIFAVYPSRKHLTPKVRVLIDFLVEAFRMRAWAGSAGGRDVRQEPMTGTLRGAGF